jgi:hypothetical protein
MASIKFALISDVHVDLTDPAPSQSFGDSPGYRLPGNEDQSLPLFISRANTENVDFSVCLGDTSNLQDSTGTANSLQRWDDYMDGTIGDGLDSEMFLCIGHHDIGGQNASAADYANFFANVTQPTSDPPQNPWWPTDPDVANDSPCAYYIDKEGFRVFFLCDVAGGNGVNTDTDGESGVTAMTQLEWVELYTNGAQSTTNPIIVFSHNPALQNNLKAHLEGLTNAVIVFTGHLHATQTIERSNGVTYIEAGADVWGKTVDDTDRFSHAIVEVDGPVYSEDSQGQLLFNIEGYGYQESSDSSTSLRARWKLNEPTGTSGADSIIDSENGNNGTPSTAVTSVAGPVDQKALTFDGTDEVTGDDEILTDYPLTEVVWVRLDSISSDGFALSIGASAIATHISLGVDSTGKALYAIKKGIGTTQVIGTTNIVDGKWYLIAGVSAAINDHKVYVNGVVENSAVPSKNVFADTINRWAIARKEHSSPGENLAADIDDARIYAGALTAAELKAIYDAQLYRNPEYEKDYNKLHDDDIFSRANGAQYEDGQNVLHENGNNVLYEDA